MNGEKVLRSNEKLMNSLGDSELIQLLRIVGSQTAITFEPQDNGTVAGVSGFAGAKELIKNASGECGHYAEVLYYEQLVDMLKALTADMQNRLAGSRRRFIASNCEQRDVLRRKQEEYRRLRFRDRVLPPGLPPELLNLLKMARGNGMDVGVVEISGDNAEDLGKAFHALIREARKRRAATLNDFEDEDETDEVEYEDEDDEKKSDIPEQRKSKD